MTYRKKIKSFLHRHYHWINRTVDLADAVGEDVVLYATEPSVVKALKVLVRGYKSFKDNRKPSDIEMKAKDWIRLPKDSISQLFVKEMEEHHPHLLSIIWSDKEESLRRFESEGIVAHIVNDWSKLSEIFIEEGDEESLKRWWRKSIEDRVGNNIVFTTRQNEEGWKPSAFIIEPDCYRSQHQHPRTQGIVDSILAYRAVGKGISILLYGPPGTGKSSIVREVVEALRRPSVRFNRLGSFSSHEIKELLDLVDSPIVIVEDIDHLEITESDDLLEKFQSLNQQNIVILGTANQIQELDPALIRPDRFDRLIEISHLDEESARSLLPQIDEEWFQSIKEFPVALLQQLKERIEIEGLDSTKENWLDIKIRGEGYRGEVYRLKVEDPKEKED